MATVNNPSHAALIASPGMGHLIPVLELGKRLLTNHTFDAVTIFVVATDHSPTARSQLMLKQTTDTTSLNVVVMPEVDVSSKLPPKPSLGERIALTMIETLPSIQSSILSMKHPPSLLIVDFFGTLALPMARDLGLLSYVFMTTSAWFSAVTIYLPAMDDPKQMEESHLKNREPVLIPGCEPLRFEDTFEPFENPGGPAYQGYLAAAKEMIAADGILMNTWQDLEPAATKAVGESGILSRFARGPVLPVGPLVRTAFKEEVRGNGHEAVMEWLDRQPTESVIYVSFGSGGTMSKAQIRELALGLELSMQRFVWVVRPPIEGDVSAAFFDVANGGDGLTEYLPEGFAERTKEFGILVPMWAPQAEILDHPATGGFVTHCGWNSSLEGIVYGVPMVAWPLYAEQKMNARWLSEGLGVAVRVKASTEDGEGGGVVEREEIARLVRRVMVDEEGGEMRKKVKELKLSGEKALSEFGTSYESLCQLKNCELRLQDSEAKAQGA